MIKTNPYTKFWNDSIKLKTVDENIIQVSSSHWKTMEINNFTAVINWAVVGGLKHRERRCYEFYVTRNVRGALALLGGHRARGSAVRGGELAGRTPATSRHSTRLAPHSYKSAKLSDHVRSPYQFSSGQCSHLTFHNFPHSHVPAGLN